MDRSHIRPLLEAAAVVGGLYLLRVQNLTAFDFFGMGPLYPSTQLPLVLLAYFGTVAASYAVPETQRQRVGLVGGVLAGMAAYPALMMGFLLLAAACYGLMHAPFMSTRQKVLALLVGHLGLAALAPLDPLLQTGALIFVNLTFFRLVRYLHHLHGRKYPPVSLEAFLHYLFPASSFVIHPYLVVVPPFGPLPGQARTRTALHRDALLSIWLGLLQLIASYGVIATSHTYFFEPGSNPLRWHAWAMLDLLYVLLSCAGHAGFLVGLMRLEGRETRDAFQQPWFARSLFDYWNRFIIHYKDLQVAVFYFPTVLALRKQRREVAVVGGMAMTFLVGNNLMHLVGRYLFTGDAAIRFPHAAIQNAALTLTMTAAILWEERQSRRKAAGLKRFELPGPIGRGLATYFTLAITSLIWHL